MSAFDWEANLRLAQELQKREDEAALRCAIGRAYYAVFGKARNRWISENGPIPLDVNVHQFVWNAIRRNVLIVHHVRAQTRAKSFLNGDGRRQLIRLKRHAQNLAHLPAAQHPQNIPEGFDAVPLGFRQADVPLAQIVIAPVILEADAK